MIDWSFCAAVEQDPERYSGAWPVRGTRVPVGALYENLEDDAQVLFDPDTPARARFLEPAALVWITASATLGREFSWGILRRR